MTGHASETRGLTIALVSYLVLFIAQLIVFLSTNILVLLAEALHTLSDTLISIFLLFAVFWSRKPADEFHMFGHGRAQNVAALVAATIFISFMSMEMFREALPRLLQPSYEGEFQNLNLALAVTVFAMVVSAIPLADILRLKSKGASAKAQLIALVKDEVSDVSALLGVILVAQGFYLADPLASVIVAVIIAIGGLLLFIENFHYLVGRAPNKQFFENMRNAAMSVNGVLGVHDLRAEYIGPDIVHTGFHIEVAEDTPLKEADRIAEEVREKVSRETGCQHCVIHVDPKTNTANLKEVNSKE